MTYYLNIEDNRIVSIGTNPFNEQIIAIEIPIEFKRDGVCKNNWIDIYEWLDENTEFKNFGGKNK